MIRIGYKKKPPHRCYSDLRAFLKGLCITGRVLNFRCFPPKRPKRSVNTTKLKIFLTIKQKTQ